MESNPTSPSEIEAAPAKHRSIRKILKKKWPEYLIEVIVIVAGITISFGLEEMRANANEAELEATYLQSLLSDVTSDIQDLQKSIENSNRLLQLAKDFLELTESKNPEISDEQIRSYFGMLSKVSFTPHSSTFNSIDISDPKVFIKILGLKNNLIDYYRYCSYISVCQDDEQQRIINIYQLYLVGKFPSKSFVKPYYPLFPEKIISREKFLNDMGLSNIITMRILDIGGMISRYDHALSIAKQIRHDLDAKIKNL